jgi:hypothetical protein
VAAGGDLRPIAGTPPAVAALPWLADENFNNNILRALFYVTHDLDVVQAQDVGLTGADGQTYELIAPGRV